MSVCECVCVSVCVCVCVCVCVFPSRPLSFRLCVGVQAKACRLLLSFGQCSLPTQTCQREQFVLSFGSTGRSVWWVKRVRFTRSLKIHPSPQKIADLAYSQ